MGKRSQALGRWPKRQRSPHTFSDRVVDVFGKMFRVISHGLTRPEKEVLRKRLDDRGRSAR